MVRSGLAINIDPRLCVLCRGRNWCGLSYCPLLAKRIAGLKLLSVLKSTDIYGSSPPSVFIGRLGYPFVNVGLSTPPEVGNTWIYDYPEGWLDLKLEEVLSYRLSMITGINRCRINDLDNSFVNRVQEVALSIKPVDVEINLAKPVKPLVSLYEHEPPLGPRSTVRSIKVVGNPSIPKVLDRVFNDHYLSASEAIILLYKEGVPVSTIHRALSVGALGRLTERRMVPTRWSITAVDSTVSGKLLEQVKKLPLINKYALYVRCFYDNLFIAILAPGAWSYEWMEAWFPGSTWNPSSSDVVIEGDYENYGGRRDYPGIGGCYYAARVATVEHLLRVGRQATCILLREIYPGFNIPIGVWFVRENIRRMFIHDPVIRTDRFEEIVEVFNKYSKVGFKVWLNHSRLLKRIMFGESITKYLEKNE